MEMAVSGIPEVGLFFGNRLYRGNRTTKISTWKFDAFNSPNFPPLAEVGVDITINKHLSAADRTFQPFFTLDPSVFVIRSFPGLQGRYIMPLLDNDFKAFLIEAYGAGTISMEDTTLIEFIEKAIDNEKIVAVKSQCSHGSVFLHVYKSSKELKRLGALSCADMTIETSLMKMMYLLAKHNNDLQEISRLFEHNIAGELSEKESRSFEEAEL